MASNTTVKGKLSASARKSMQAQKRAEHKAAVARKREIKRQVKSTMQRAIHVDPQAKYREANRAYQSGAKHLLSVVATSYGHDPMIDLKIEAGIQMTGATDFKKIVMTAPSPVDTHGNPMDDAAMEEWVKMLSGLGYHELGHIVFTIPFQWMPFGAAGVMTDDIKSLHHPWNLLEDQRMEQAMIQESPVMQAYFTNMMIKHMGETPTPGDYLMLAGRTYMSENLRAMLRAAFVESYGEDLCQRAEKCIAQYQSTTDMIELCLRVIDFRKIMDEVQALDRPKAVDQHGDPNGGFDPEGVEKMLQEAATGDGEPTPPTQPASEEGEGEGGEDGPGAGGDDPSDEGGSNKGGDKSEGDTSGEGTPNTSEEGDYIGIGSDSTNDFHEGIKDEIDKIQEGLKKDRLFQKHLAMRTKDMLRVVHHKLGGTLGIPRMRATQGMDAGVKHEAEGLAKAMVRSLEVAMAPMAPKWNRNVGEGYLDPFRYRVRDRNDRNFYRNRDGEDSNDFDVAVSLVLDVSGSMSGSTVELSQLAYAVKSACFQLDIPCTVTAYDTGAYVVYDHDETAAPQMLNVGGGTNPTSVLQTVPEQDHGKAHHVVIMMTDGGWFDVSLVKGMEDQHRHNLGFVFNGASGSKGLTEPSDSMRELFNDAGFPHVWNVSNLTEIANQLRNYLTANAHQMARKATH